MKTFTIHSIDRVVKKPLSHYCQKHALLFFNFDCWVIWLSNNVFTLSSETEPDDLKFPKPDTKNMLQKIINNILKLFPDNFFLLKISSYLKLSINPKFLTITTFCPWNLFKIANFLYSTMSRNCNSYTFNIPLYKYTERYEFCFPVYL